MNIISQSQHDQTNRKSLTVSEPSLGHQKNDRGYYDTEFGEVPNREMGLGEYIDMILRRKKTVVTIFSFFLVSSIAYTFLVDPVYRSVATLEVEKETGASLSSLGESLTQGFTGVSENEVFATQIGIIKDRTMSDGLIRKLNLTESPEFNKRPGWLSVTLSKVKNEIISWFGHDEFKAINPQVKKEAFIDKVQQRILAKRDGQSRLINVSFDAGTPESAQELLQNLIDIYLAMNLDKRRRVQREGNSWLNGEIEKAEKKVLSSLESIVSFSEKHGMVSVDEGANHVMAFFQKAAEGLIKTKEQRIGMEAFQRQGISSHAAAAINGVKTPDLEQLHGKLSLLESEHAQMKEIYSDNYPKVVLLIKQINFLKDRIEESQAKAVDSIVKTAKEQESLSEQAFENAKRLAMENKSLSVQFAVLKKEAQTNEEIFSLLLKKSKELQLSTEIIGNNILTVVNPTLPVEPVMPRTALNLSIGAMLGTIFGIGAAFLKERLDSSVYDARDLERLRITNLGMIPNYEHVGKLEGTKEENSKLPVELRAINNPSSMLADAFSIVRTSFLLTTSYADIRTVLITSAVPNEGKSFVSVSLATLLASGDRRVLIVEGDFRKPRISKLFGQKNDARGLSTLLSHSDMSIKKCIQKLSTPNLFLLGIGPKPNDPARLLGSSRMADLILELRKMFDLVIIDGPPIEGLPDSRILATYVDGVVFVIRQGHAAFEVIRSAYSTLGRTRHDIIIGAVFNDVGVSSPRHSPFGSYGSYGFGHYSKYGYSSYYRVKRTNV